MKIEEAIMDMVMKNPKLTQEEINDKFLEFVFDTDDEELRLDFYKRCTIIKPKATDNSQSPDKPV